MATYTWYLQGTSPTTIEATDIIQFAAATFDSKITVSEYNDSTHVESSIGANDSDGNSPYNSKFISNDGGTAGDGQVDIGAGTVDIDTVSEANCPLKINFSHASAVSVTDHIIYAYDGTTTTAVPTGVTFYIAEQGNANWTNAEGSAAALAVGDSGSATSHDFFFLISASPESVGEKTDFTLRSELTYS